MNNDNALNIEMLLAHVKTDIIDVSEIDDMLDSGIPVEKFAGKKLKYHWNKVLDLVNVDGELRAILPVSCEKCGRELGEVLIGSGVHNGAWCYVFSEVGDIIMDLRNDRFVCKGACKNEKAQSLVEFAIVLPLLLLLLLGVFEVGWALRGYLILANANREAARFAVKQDYLDFHSDYVNYPSVLSHTHDSLANQIPIDFSSKDTMIISYIEVAATCTGTLTMTTPIDVLTYTWTVPATSSEVTRINYTEIAETALAQQLKHSCAEEAFSLTPAPNGILTVEMFYYQPQLFGFPIISNPFTDPVPMYVHSTFRKIIDSRAQP